MEKFAKELKSRLDKKIKEWTEIRDKLWVYKLTNEPSNVDEPEYRELLKKVDEVGKELAMVESEVDEYFNRKQA